MRVLEQINSMYACPVIPDDKDEIGEVTVGGARRDTMPVGKAAKQ